MSAKTTRTVCFALTCALSVSLLTGCGKSSDNNPTAVSSTAAGDSSIPALASDAVDAPVPSPTPTPQLLTQKQQDSINMLNYLTMLIQEIHDAKNNRVSSLSIMLSTVMVPSLSETLIFRKRTSLRMCPFLH